MAEITHMPKLSDTMVEGVVAEWHKKVGDTVEAGELLAEIETDKATMEFESFYDGVLLYIGVKKGETAPVDSVLCITGEKGEDYKAILAAAEAEASAAETKKEEPEKAEPKKVSEPTPKSEPAKIAASAPAPVVAAPFESENTNGRVKASPMAKRVAQERGLDISFIPGSGDGGRVVKRDVESFNPAISGGVAPILRESFEEEEVSQMRKTIARRLGESKFTAPHFYLTIDIDMDNAIATRKALIERDGNKISFNDFVVKSAASALRRHPNVNSSWLETKIRRNKHVHIGVAVAVEDGLLVPVVRFADSKPLAQINSEVKAFSQKAKDKKLQPEDWEGSTFTISNLGMFGIEEFTAIINPPDACIMAVGAIRETPVVKDGQLAVGNRMKVTLSCDHRVVDGATGAAFLSTFKANLENPALMFA